VPILARLSQVWLRTRVSIFHLQLWSEKAVRIVLVRTGYRVVYLRREMELGWPLERYMRVYLHNKLHVPRPLVWVATEVASLLFVQFGTLRNKAICLAQRVDAR
jgi:hypothetical protein